MSFSSVLISSTHLRVNAAEVVLLPLKKMLRQTGGLSCVRSMAHTPSLISMYVGLRTYIMWRRVLTLIYVNDEENLRVTANIAYLNHVHFENVYMKPILVLLDKVKTFLDAYSTGKRTFFGVE